jgi:hypothetical protein
MHHTLRQANEDPEAVVVGDLLQEDVDLSLGHGGRWIRPWSPP